MKKWKKTGLIVASSLAWTWPYVINAADKAQATLSNPFGSTASTDPVYIVARVIQALLGVVGAVTLLIFIWGGFKMIFSGGNEEKIKKGRSTLVWAVIGLAIILSSYTILDYIFNLIETASKA